MVSLPSVAEPSVPKPGDAFPYLFDHSRDTTTTEIGVPTVVPADLPRIGAICRDLPRKRPRSPVLGNKSVLTGKLCRLRRS